MTVAHAEPREPAPFRVVASATAAMTQAVVPAFLIGATAVQIREDLHFDERSLGLVVGLFFASTSLTSMPGGRLADRMGPRRGLVLSTVLGTASLLGIAVLARSLWALVAFAVVGGASTGVALPAASLALVRGAPLRPGLMFGLKQSAPPAASLMAGIAVPAISLQVGWRWAFAAPVALGVLALVILPPAGAFVGAPASVPDRSAHASIRREFRSVGIGVALASAVALSMGAFLVTSSVASGIGPGAAGVLLAAGSVVGIGSRLIAGALGDRYDEGHLLGVAGMVGVGSLGFLALAIGSPLMVAAAGVVLAYGFGYGWSGLLFYSVSHLNPDAPGLAVGIVNTGATAGAALGPVLFGLLVSVSSFGVAWSAAAATALAGALVLARASVRIRARGPVPQPDRRE